MLEALIWRTLFKSALSHLRDTQLILTLTEPFDQTQKSLNSYLSPLSIQNFMSDTENFGDQKNQRAKELLGRLKVVKIHEMDKLLILLAKILSQLKHGQQTFNLKLIIIDSLSSLFWEVGSKSLKQHERYQQQIKEVLYYFKCLTRRHHVGVIFTNNCKDAGVTRVTDLQNQVGEPLQWAADKQIYANCDEHSINYIFIKH